ncbi:enoyl-CoA delta isomerase 2, peroxisomal-like [Lolium perenne]|uniref:enoyl-CoA delta isomerase 2, peroxisomal-like n=1 Tax=Lolium perenne TaxID=4522 RepID=UPI0021F668DA|nr:enoyl-CoA delta isomerase 2, peroxisomal-like [Lolium perenne]
MTRALVEFAAAAETPSVKSHTQVLSRTPTNPPPSRSPQAPERSTMCTLEQRGRVFVLTLTGDGEHRLGIPLMASIRSALSSVAAQAAQDGPGAALVTVAEGRFFSNGLDIGWVGTSRARLAELINALRPLAADLLALPMPTVAAVTGHASAGGFLLALCHDYRVMRADRGVLYMSEVDLGFPLPPYFMALLRAKITATQALRDVVLRGARIRAPQAKEMGIVDVVCPGAPETAAEALKLAEQLAARKWDDAVYSSIRISMFPDACMSVGIVQESDEEKARNFAPRL